MLKVEHINPFIGASQCVIKMLCNINTTTGKVHLRATSNFYNQVIIIIGLVGKIKGQVSFEMPLDTAKNIASIMMGGMLVEELDDISKSAISEMGNMIMGNACSLFASNGIIIDITPPALITGENIDMLNKTSTIVVPLELESIGSINININAEDVA
jgi:chemotaxis protein CheX